MIMEPAGRVDGTTPGGMTCKPSEVFLQSLTSEVNKEDVYHMVQAQQHMLSRFEKTNEMLLNFNSLSKARYEQTCQDFQKHTTLLGEMRKDLDCIFKRIRTIKGTLGKQYPAAFSACSDVCNVIEDDKEEDQDATTPLQPVQPSMLPGQQPPRLPRQHTLPAHSSARPHGHRVLPRQHSMPAPLPEEPTTPIREPAIGAEEDEEEDLAPLGARSQPDGSADGSSDKTKSK